jgi:hypothetical protein
MVVGCTFLAYRAVVGQYASEAGGGAELGEYIRIVFIEIYVFLFILLA